MGSKCSFLQPVAFGTDDKPCCKHCDHVRRLQLFQFFLLISVSAFTYFTFNMHGNCSCRGNSEEIALLKLQLGVLEHRLHSIRSDMGKSAPAGSETISQGRSIIPKSMQKNLVEDRIFRYRRSYRQNKARRRRSRSKKVKRPCCQVKSIRRKRSSTESITKKIRMVHVEGSYVKGAVHNTNGTYSRWKYADWFKQLNEQKFKLNYSTGELRVQEGGLYLLYAQITMIGHVKHGFYVKKNNNIISTCNNSFETHKNSSSTDAVSCSTVGIFPLDANDKVSIQHTSTQGTKALFDANSSFFGLYRIAVIKKRPKKGNVLI